MNDVSHFLDCNVFNTHDSVFTGSLKKFDLGIINSNFKNFSTGSEEIVPFLFYANYKISCLHLLYFTCRKEYVYIFFFLAEYDECASLDHGCEHICINQLGGYECQCKIGYELHSDGKRCEGELLLFISSVMLNNM